MERPGLCWGLECQQFQGPIDCLGPTRLLLHAAAKPTGLLAERARRLPMWELIKRSFTCLLPEFMSFKLFGKTHFSGKYKV